MRQPNFTDYSLLVFLGVIWASAFFNIKIATDSFGPITIAFIRVLLGSIPLIILCLYKNIKIEVFSKDWPWFATIGFVNMVFPFFLIAYGVKEVQSNLAAILMSTSPLTSTLLAHFFLKEEKINILKVTGVLIGFSGIVYLFSDNFLINENNIFSALCILIGSLGYVVGGILTYKISNKKNENVTASILIWATIILLPICFYFEKPWNYSPSLTSVVSITYLGVIATGLAWVLRFKVLKENGLVFQSQVAYLIPIFAVILGYVFLNELITFKVIIALIAIVIGIFIVKKSTSSKKILTQKSI
tara:strand:- start:386 stop:1291 length:906 start_codon:yes stop_codon:yes gene_type:complete